ncbi:MAG: cytochrome b [Kangiellaceae bacterium]|nr:cytochrome b [Kangiellaceae bacterium]
MLKNTSQNYGLVSKLLHWAVALMVISLFSVGVWMVELDYYSEWYKQAPFLHKSFGIVLAIIMVARLVWRWLNPRPEHLASHTHLEQLVAHIAHIVLYLLIFSLIASGYLISTADNRGIDVFNWFTVPSMGSFVENQEDIAGLFHEWIAYGLIGLVVVHALAALKHHFIDKDQTLKRML